MDKLLEILNNINPDIDYINEKKLMDDGLIDSLAIVNLIVGIEDEFGVEIDPEYIIPENFNSVESIYQLIQKYDEGNVKPTCKQM